MRTDRRKKKYGELQIRASAAFLFLPNRHDKKQGDERE